MNQLFDVYIPGPANVPFFLEMHETKELTLKQVLGNIIYSV